MRFEAVTEQDRTEDMSEPDRHGIDADEDLRAIDQEPSVEGLIAELSSLMTGGDGWGGIETTPAALAKQRQESLAAMKRQANDFRDCFATPAGRRVLDMLIAQTLRAEPYPEEAQLPMDAIAPLLLAHDARCRLVRGILAAIAQAENRPATTTGA